MKLTESKLREIIQEEIKSIRESVESLLTESTRSTIAIEDKSGKVHGTYVHSDGYLKGVGAVLKNSFLKADKVEKLLNLGKFGISYLEDSIEGGDGHTFGKPNKGETVFYGRDRREKNDMTSDFKDRDAFLSNHTEEFAYMFSIKDKKWYYNNPKVDNTWNEL